MHVHAHIEGMHVDALGMFAHAFARIKHLAVIRICLLFPRDECVSALMGCMCLSACGDCWNESQAYVFGAS